MFCYKNLFLELQKNYEKNCVQKYQKKLLKNFSVKNIKKLC